MAKSLRDANWGAGGLLCVFLAVANFVAYLTTGSGLPSRMGHNVKGVGAVLGSLFFLFLGLVSICVWFALKVSRRR